MKLDDNKIKEILLRENYITYRDITAADAAAKARRMELTDYLIGEKFITRELLGQAIAESFGVQFADLNANPPAKELVVKLPEIMTSKFHAVLYKEDENSVVVASDNPVQTGLGESAGKYFPRKTVMMAFSFPEDIDNAFIHYRKSLGTRFSKIIAEGGRIAPEIVGEIVEDIIVFRASDIHFEPEEQEVVIRFRVDGVLHEAGRIPKLFYENILNWIKVQADMRIDEHHSAQDGAMRYVTKDGGAVDMRVSVIPILDGEKISIRVLSQYVQNFSLNDLGLSVRDHQIIKKSSKKPFGMMLVTGPTGSGKTTTLYAIIKLLNRPEVNITTIEDPVEYKIIGVNQIRVNLQTNLTFAKGLRSIIRQDPDIILVGEIRDQETAEIGVNAALTGHLLLSTFHANDAATAIPRLLDMGVEPFLLASTLDVIVAQRLARKICAKCRISQVVSQNVLRKRYPNAANYFVESKITLYRGKGCEACNHTGYKGRIAFFEILEISKDMKELILSNPSSDQIWQLARAQGAKTLFEDGLEKVKNGITAIEELFRVAEPPHIGGMNGTSAKKIQKTV